MVNKDENTGLLELQLANGKAYAGTSGFEMACFLASDGASIVPPGRNKSKGGKSKGARNKGKSKARQPRHVV